MGEVSRNTPAPPGPFAGATLASADPVPGGKEPLSTSQNVRNTSQLEGVTIWEYMGVTTIRREVLFARGAEKFALGAEP